MEVARAIIVLALFAANLGGIALLTAMRVRQPFGPVPPHARHVESRTQRS